MEARSVLTIAEEAKLIGELARHLGMECEHSGLDDEACYKVTKYVGLILKKPIFVYFKPSNIEGTRFATRDTSEILGVLNDKHRTIDLENGVAAVIADLDAEIRIAIAKRVPNLQVSDIKDIPEASDILKTRDVHWNILKIRGSRILFGHLWYSHNGKNDVYWKVIDFTDSKVNPVLILSKVNGIALNPTGEHEKLTNELHAVLNRNSKRLDTDPKFKKYRENLVDIGEQKTMLENLNNPLVKLFTGNQIGGEPSFMLGNFLGAMKYKGDIYTPSDNSIMLFLHDGRLRTPRDLLPENTNFGKSLEQEIDESKGRCKFCMKNVVFTEKMVLIFVEEGKKIYLKSKDGGINGHIAQFYVNVCNNCGDMEPWKLNKDQLPEMKALMSRLKANNKGDPLKVADPKNSVNEDSLLKVIKRGILVKRSK